MFFHVVPPARLFQGFRVPLSSAGAAPLWGAGFTPHPHRLRESAFLFLQEVFFFFAFPAISVHFSPDVALLLFLGSDFQTLSPWQVGGLAAILVGKGQVLWGPSPLGCCGGWDINREISRI